MDEWNPIQQQLNEKNSGKTENSCKGKESETKMQRKTIKRLINSTSYSKRQ